ncbi:hypothetical protein GCK32_019812 [Trichostrongylus colubriformis]|uniref:Uncharacterized protein n=1 Tax=Trichostrongylus colubriformis TaxID=6319 RepID=A0AAN8FXZ2_TRICO
MLFYALTAFMVLNAFTQGVVMAKTTDTAKECKDDFTNAICEKYVNDNSCGSNELAKRALDVLLVFPSMDALNIPCCMFVNNQRQICHAFDRSLFAFNRQTVCEALT